MAPLSIVMAAVLSFGGDLDGVVIDFTARSCPPCEKMSPIVSKLERQGLPIRKVDVRVDPELARRFNIQGTPTFVLIVDGKERSRIVGETSEDELVRLCKRVPQTANSRDSLGEPGEMPRKSNPGRDAAPEIADNPVAKAAPKRSGLSWPFGPKKAEEPATLSDSGSIGRGKAAPRSLQQVPVQGNPLAATVRIRVRDASGDSYGTGTIIDSCVGRTVIATCGHILRHCDKNSVIEIDWFEKTGVRTSIGKPLYHDEKNDVGLITANVDCVPSCRVAPADTKLLKGTPVVTVGCNGGDNPTVQNSKITYLNRFRGPDNIEVAGMPVEGRSGGGVFTKEGLLIGVCSGADEKYNEGYYIGLKTLHKVLDKCQLSRLYKEGPAADDSAIGDLANDDSADEADEGEEEEVADAAPAPAAKKPGKDRVELALNEKPRKRPVQRNSDGVMLDGPSDAVLDDSLQAEIVCFIRPTKPGAPSRVVILNRASRKFVEYLADEINDQPEIVETSVHKSERSSPRKPAATQRVQRPLSAAEPQASAIENERAESAGPQPYRRKTSR